MASAIIVYLAVILFIVFYVAVLPLIQGVAQIKRRSPGPTRQSEEEEDEDEPQAVSSSAYSGYVPPSDRYLESKVTKKNKSNSGKKSSGGVPLNYVPTVEKEKKVFEKGYSIEEEKIRKNPDVYDYDLDELINEERAKDAEERLKQFQREMQTGDSV